MSPFHLFRLVSESNLVPKRLTNNMFPNAPNPSFKTQDIAAAPLAATFCPTPTANNNALVDST